VRLVLAIAALAVASGAQTIGQRLDSSARSQAENGRFSGVVLVARNGTPIIRKAYGLANIELQVPNQVDTKFRIGSVTKQFTAAAIMLLQERGRLTTSDPLCKHLPSCPAAWSQITLEHLLTHRSGIPDVFTVPGFMEAMAQPTTLEKIVAGLGERPLVFAPGSKFQYSNSGYQVLALVVETVSTQPYAEFMEENIFSPLRLTDTGTDRSESVLPNRAAGYSKDQEGKVINAAPIHMSVPLGAGSMYSTASDLLRWSEALWSGKLLKKESLNVIFAGHGTADWGDTVGYGWFMGKDKHGHAYAAQTGGINGFGAQIMRFPDQKLTIILLSNYSFAKLPEMANELEAIASAQN
jgi:D-alanyl-D-alanine carboxypeptidase